MDRAPDLQLEPAIPRGTAFQPQLRGGRSRRQVRLSVQPHISTTTTIPSRNYPSGLRAIFRDGVPDSVNTYNTPTGLPRCGTSNHCGVRAGQVDAVSPVDDRTRASGCRHTDGWLPGRRVRWQTIFIAGPVLRRGQGRAEFPGCGRPRLSVIYDMFGNGLTALKVTANRYRPRAGYAVYRAGQSDQGRRTTPG